MDTTKRNYVLIIIGAVLIIGGAFWYMNGRHFGPPPDLAEFHSSKFTFSYPRIYITQEYSADAVSIGTSTPAGFIPLADVVQYHQDPDKAAPPSFNDFVKRQATALCGTDSAVSVSCTDPVVTGYTTTTGVHGSLLTLTLTKKNLKTGVTSAVPYGPIYVFDATQAVSSDNPLSYEAVFVYPSFSSFVLISTTSPEFIQSIADSLTVGEKKK